MSSFDRRDRPSNDGEQEERTSLPGIEERESVEPERRLDAGEIRPEADAELESETLRDAENAKTKLEETAGNSTANNTENKSLDVTEVMQKEPAAETEETTKTPATEKEHDETSPIRRLSAANYEDLPKRDAATEKMPEESFFASPGTEGMDKVQKTLRIMIILGFFPFIWVSWFFGMIYGIFVKKTKKVQRKLVWFLVLLTFGALAILAIPIGIILWKKEKPVYTIAEMLKTDKCNEMKIHLFPKIDDYNKKVMLFVFESPHESFMKSTIFDMVKENKYSVLAVGVGNFKVEDHEKSDEIYGLKKYRDLIECIAINPEKELTLVTVFDKNNAAEFATKHNSDRYASVLAINAYGTYRSTPGNVEITTATTPTHIAFFNKKIQCGKQSYIPAVEITIDGKKSYRKRYDGYQMIFDYFTQPLSRTPKMKPIELSEETSIKRVLEELVDPLTDFMAYDAALSADGIVHAVLCEKARN